MGATDYESTESCFPKALNADTVWVARFGDKDWRHYLRRWAQDYKFEKTLGPRLDREQERWHQAQPEEPKPVIIQHEIDDTLQTGDSRLLGGAMSIHAPWSNDAKQDPPN